MNGGGQAFEYLLSSTPAPTPSLPTSGPSDVSAVAGASNPLVIIGLAVITLVGTGVTAIAPTLLELAKRRVPRPGRPPVSTSAPPATPDPSAADTQMIQSTQGISMIEQAFAAVLDYRQQRDEAIAQRNHAQERLRRADAYIRRQEAYIRSLENRLGIQRENSNPDPQSRGPGQGWDGL